MSAGSPESVAAFDDGSPLAPVPDGTTLLVAGPPLSGTARLVLSDLGRCVEDDGAAVAVTTSRTADGATAACLRGRPGADRTRVGVVECQTTGRPDDRESVRIRRPSSPADLTGIGISVSDLLSRFDHPGVGQTRVAIDSLSTLLLYSPFERVCRFLHALSMRITRADCVGLFVCNPATVDRGQFDQLVTLVDGVAELRRRDAGVDVRLRGIDGAADWTALERP